MRRYKRRMHPHLQWKRQARLVSRTLPEMSDYFTIFKANASDLASLDPAVVNDITAFYTFLKASRDATGAMQLWTSPQHQVVDKQKDIIAIIFSCFLMSVHGQRGLKSSSVPRKTGRSRMTSLPAVCCSASRFSTT
ncbi:hypothetical protein ACVW1C_005826 [Bradyrhizobium sp. USDA 4011]